jgi:hypothetical protein
MNGDNQPQQEQYRLIERLARVETAIEYQGKAMSEGFARVDAHFRILFSLGMTTAFGTLGLILKALGLF